MKIGTPNACNGCHDKEDRAVGRGRHRDNGTGPSRRQEAHYGEAFAAARARRPGALSGLEHLVS